MDNDIKKELMIVIFGATGDLTKRKLIPALFQLYKKNNISTKNPIVCISRSDMSNDNFISRLDMKKYIPKVTKDDLDDFIKLIKYHSLDFSENCNIDKCESCDNCKTLAMAINTLDKNNQCHGNRIFYLATPPSTFENISRIIRKTLPENCKGQMKIAFEKPFGFDLESSRKLNKSISTIFNEDEIYRVDHYMGKALVQDILLFRFSNLLYEQVWNNKFIDNIQITISESMGVEYRAGYYDKTGAIKDMLQNHLMQLLSLVAMDEPQSFNAVHVRREMSKIPTSLKLPHKNDLVISQYKRYLDNKNTDTSYIEEYGVSNKSKTETFVALKMEIDNNRWRGVPIYVRTGKRLKSTFAEMNIVFKDVSCKLFPKGTCYNNSSNTITIRIQPDTGIALSFNIKKPGPGPEIMPVKMDFCHHCLFNLNTPEAYEAVFQAIINGDQTIFTSWDSVESSWKYTDHILDIAKNKDLSYYGPGSTGPKEACDLLGASGRKWIN